MSHVQVLREIESRGLSITASGENLRLQGPKERIDTELVGRIREVKAELIAYLSAPPPEPEGFALTLLQRGYLIGRGDAVQMGNVASHVYHEIEGVWDLDRLDTALRSVVARHGMLRTRFTADGRQVEEEAPPDGPLIGRHDLRGATEAVRAERRAALRAERTHRLLPVDRAPLLAAEVAILAEDRMVLYVGHDGLVMDGISMFLFFRDWWDAYTNPDAPVPEEASFAAYVAALERSRTRAPAERSRAYWMERLDDLAPHPDLPLRTSPSAITHPRFTQHVARLDAPSWTALKARASAAGLTPTGVLLAAYGETLARWGAGDRFTLATTLANRPPIHPRIFDAIGNFSETMLVGIERDRSATFEERARALQARLRRDIDNRHFSGIEVLRELGRRAGTAGARMPYTFNSAIGYVHADLDGSALELFGPEVHTSSQTPQLWLNGFAFEQHGGVVVQFDSVDGLFPEGFVEAMVAGYQTLLDALLDEPAWSATAFDLMPEEQKARRRAANDTGAPPLDGLLHDAFRAQAERAPDAPAIMTSGATMSYGELYARARHAAAWLRERGTGRDELVGLVMTRGPEQVVGILATVLAGGAYLPIDAGLPEERRRYMLRDGRVRSVLTNVAALAGDDVLVLDATLPAEPDAPAHVPVAGAGPDDLAYVLYTSGTTGEPKGVMVSHRNVAGVVADCAARFAIEAGDRFFGVSAFNFDLSVWDVFGALSAGAAIVLPDHDRAADPAHWLELCAKTGVTVWNSVPAIVALMHDQAAAEGIGPPPALRLVMMSGDRIPARLPARLWALKDDLTVISLGGPTETTIWNILHPVTAEDGREGTIPYGRPNAGNRAYVLDAEGRDAPDWVTGEICAAGTGLARGYWGDDARTTERFFHDERRGERLYRTGDLGRYLPDGDIEILGRSDFQIKVNGYRIEAGEVETRLTGIDAVKEAAVVRQPGAHGDRLVAHLVPAGDAQASDEALKHALREYLPEYMTPSVFVWHESLPLTGNAKVDRARLTALAPAAAAPRVRSGGLATEVERELAGLWESILGVAEPDPDGDFYDLGGDSLAAARILTGVRKRFGVSITLDRLYEVRTVRSMA
ncbi:MAG: amino acid adenylation domain-containing protein, partial [Actinoallomurus sp.]